MFDRIPALLRERAHAQAMGDERRVTDVDRSLMALGHPMPRVERAVMSGRVSRRGRRSS